MKYNLATSNGVSLCSSEWTLAIKTFSATTGRERNALGEVASDWMEGHADEFIFFNHEALMSSDSDFTCLTIVISYYRPRKAQEPSDG